MQSLVGVPWQLAVVLCMLLDRMLNPHRAVGEQDFSALTHRDSSSTQLRTERCFLFFFSVLKTILAGCHMVCNPNSDAEDKKIWGGQ